MSESLGSAPPPPPGADDHVRGEGGVLVVEYGDCEMHGSCQCGKQLGTTAPDASLDTFVQPWERHTTTEVGD